MSFDDLMYGIRMKHLSRMTEIYRMRDEFDRKYPSPKIDLHYVPQRATEESNKQVALEFKRYQDVVRKFYEKQDELSRELIDRFEGELHQKSWERILGHSYSFLEKVKRLELVLGQILKIHEGRSDGK